MDKHSTHTKHSTHNHPYRKFAVMIVLSFIAMYILMYSMVDSFPNILSNFNQIYMASLMTAAMALIEITIMWGMYKNKKINVIIITLSSLAFILSFLFIRKQIAISDKQF